MLVYETKIEKTVSCKKHSTLNEIWLKRWPWKTFSNLESGASFGKGSRIGTLISTFKI